MTKRFVTPVKCKCGAEPKWESYPTGTICLKCTNCGKRTDWLRNRGKVAKQWNRMNKSAEENNGTVD